MNIFDFSDYRKFILLWIQNQPKRGHGQYQKIANHLGIPASVFSQTMSGRRELSLDKGFLLGEYLNLKFIEKDYFLLLVEYAAASHHKLKLHLKEKIKAHQNESKDLGHRLEEKKTLEIMDQMEFYSSWLYSAIRLHCSIGSGATFNEIRRLFSLKESELERILSFLIRTQLVEIESGKYVMSQQRLTYVGKDSPMLSKHHSNWRIKSLEKTMQLENSDYFMTFPMTCAKSDIEKIKSKISQFMVDVTTIIKDSEAEEQIYLGIDFFNIYKAREDNSN